MKKKLFLLISALIVYSGCKSDDRKPAEGKKDENVYWANFDDYLDVKSEAIIDTVRFRQEMNNLLPPKKIIELFGSGYHNFYLELKISPERKAEYYLCTDASFWRGRGEETQGFLYNMDKEPQRSEHIQLSKSNDRSGRTVANIKDKEIVGSVFYRYFPDDKNIFKVMAGLKNGKSVISHKLFEINSIVNKNNTVVNPWQIKEVSISKYMEHLFEKNVNRYYYATGLPAVSVDGFESIRKAIVYPEEALKNGVTGRVIVQIFADINGDIAGYQLLKGLGYGCDEAVINAIKNAKFKTFPTGQRSSIIVPFEFGPPQTTPIDLAVQYFFLNPDRNVYNNVNLAIVNKNKLSGNIDQDYFIYVYMDKHLVFQTICRSITKSGLQQQFWFRFQPNKPGTYEYVIYIDPENRLNDSNRENNTVRGMLDIKP